jgi:hypothetical protein
MDDADIDRLLLVYEDLTAFYERLADLAAGLVDAQPRLRQLLEVIEPFPEVILPLREVIEKSLADVPREEWPHILRDG